MTNRIQNTYQSFMKIYFRMSDASGRIEVDEVLRGLQKAQLPIAVGHNLRASDKKGVSFITAVNSMKRIFVVDDLPASCLNTLVAHESFLPMEIHQGDRIVSFQAKYRETLMADYRQDYLFDFPKTININYNRGEMRIMPAEDKAVKLSLSADQEKSFDGLVANISRSGICLGLGEISAEYFSMLKSMIGQKVNCDFQLNNQKMPCQIEIRSVRAANDNLNGREESKETQEAHIGAVLLAQNEAQERLLETYIDDLEYSKMKTWPAA